MTTPLLTQMLLSAHRIAVARNGGSAAWTRGNTTTNLSNCVFGRAFEASEDTALGGSVRIHYSDRDFIVPAADLVIANTQVLPQDGDVFEILSGAEVGARYEAMPIPGGQCYRTGDAQGVLLRIHTKRIAADS
jgi:hypothetical protein